MPKWKPDDRTGDAVRRRGGRARETATEAARGRRPATTRQDVARAALDLFARQGYDETTVDEIAAAVGVSRRTFFRYYESKPDVVWGEFDAELVRLREPAGRGGRARPAHDGRAAPVGDGHQPLRRRRARRAADPDGASSARSRPWWPTPRSGTRSGATWWPASPPAGWAARPTTSAPRRWPGPPSGRPWPPSPAGPGTTTGDLVGEVDHAFRLLATGFDEKRLPSAHPGQ